SVTAIGSTGSGVNDQAIYNTGQIAAGGTGNVVVNATGRSTGGGGQGVLVRSIASISANNGTVTVTGAAAANNFGVDFESGGRIFTSTNNAISLTTDSFDMPAGASINSGSGPTTIVERTAGTLINLGGADVLSGSPLTLGLSAAE